MSREGLRPEIWRAVRALGITEGEITARGVRRLLKGPPPRVLARIRDYLDALKAAGVLADVEPTWPCGVYRLANDPGIEAPRVRPDGSEVPENGQTRMWRCMRILRSFTAEELAAHGSLPQAQVAIATARDYAARLARVGYLTRSGERYASIPGRFQGPQAPRIRRDKHVVDPNTGIVYRPDGTEVSDD